MSPDLIARALSSENQVKVRRLFSAAGSAMQTALEMERRHGNNSWPVVSPDRGVSAYQFVHEVLRYYIAAVTGEPAANKVQYKIVDSVITGPEVRPDSTESFWRQFVEWGRPEFQHEDAGEVTLLWPEGLQELRLKARNMTLVARDSQALALPLPFPVQPMSFGLTRVLSLRVRKTVSQLTVEPLSADRTQAEVKST